MLTIQRDIDLMPFHTFHMPVKAEVFCQVDSIQSLQELRLNSEIAGKPWLVLGGGSNVLFTQNVLQPIIKVSIPGISILKSDSDWATVRVGAGVNWHELVLWSLDEGMSGLENLSLIPGQCGAAPMQNIGAYGVELKQVFDCLEAIEIATGVVHTFHRNECNFDYRTSIFKTELKNKFIITSITLKLRRSGLNLNLDYGDIRSVLSQRGITKPTPRDVSNAVIYIRQSKLPDPDKIGNAGSFFKNPEIHMDEFSALKTRFPELPGYPVTNEKVKVPAGWLIDKLGLKGYRNGDAGVHDRQALVLVNHGLATGNEILSISRHIQDRVHATYNISLEPEVNIL